jgi:GH24 family phage-related lysozyme (muramidase)
MSIDYKLLLNPRNSDQIDSISPGLLDFIKQSEGFSDSAFFDTKQFSIGYGTRANSANESIDEEEATKRLQERLSADRTQIIKFANDNGYDWGSDQINALQSFTYNLGIGSLNQLTANGTRSNDEIAEAMVKYVNAGGQPQPGLVTRRQRERLAFINTSNQNVQQVASQPVQQQLEEVDVTARKRGGGEILQEVDVTAEQRGGGEILNEVAVNQRPYQPSPSDVGAAIEYLRTSGVHRSRFDINDPFHMMLVNNAREHARGRISRGENPFYEGGTKGDPETRLKHLFDVLTPDVVDRTVPDLFSEGYKPGDAFKQYKDHMGARRDEKFIGVLRSMAGGLTFEAADELEALIRSELGGSVTKEGDYKSELALIRKQQKDFEYFNPIASTAPNLLMTLPMGGALWKTAKMLAPKASNAAIAASEGALYGAGQGDTFKQRVDYAGMGALFGLALGKVVDIATKPSSAGGLRTELDEIADSKLGSEEAVIEQLEKAAFEETLEEVSNPLYNVKPLRDAQTVGEFYDRLLQNGRKFFGDKLRGVSDSLAAEVSERFGFIYQRADTAALREINKGLAKLGPRLVPVIKIINESERAKGALLDYAGGKMITKQELGDFYFDSAQRDARGRFKKRLSPEQRGAKAKELRELAVSRLENELKGYLDIEQLNALKSYLTYSFDRNKLLNKKVFGANFGDEITYLHTRNRRWRERVMEEENLDAKGFELKYGDTAYEGRTRGSYLDPEDMSGPIVNEYDNPIVSDMQRIFKMEKFGQLQSKFGIDIAPVLAGKAAARKAAIEANEQVPTTLALTPTEFMDAFYHSLVRKGLTNDGAQYGVNKIQDHILGTAKSPHPIIQAMNSAAYALTLAGPLSAVLNLADIPLLGAKYGGKAAASGLKGVLPNRLKQIPDVDVEAMGLNNQTFGEFVSLINDSLNYPQGWMTRTAELMRQGADYAMKGSGFASLDVVGKRGVIRGVLRSAVDDSNAGNLADNWGFYFNKKELELISEQLSKHGTDWRKYEGPGKELTEELMFAGLGQQQLISAAGRPAAWARHPNLRPLWALRGFVIKQQALALRETLGNLRKGRPDLAVKFLGRYAAYGAGGYAVINEGRHAIFGDGNVSAGGLVRGYGDAWASLLTANTLGLNDYQYGKIKEEGLLMTAAKGLMPIALTRPYDIGAKTIGVIDGKRPPQALLTEVPIVRDALRLGENIADEDSFIGTITQEGFADRTTNEQFRELLRQRNTDDD